MTIKASIKCLTSLAIASLAITFCTVGFAADKPDTMAAFQDGCLKGWLSGANGQPASDYKKFGELLCSCAGTKMQHLFGKKDLSQDELEKSKQSTSTICLSETIITHAFNAGAKDENALKDECNKSWSLVIAPAKMNDEAKTFTQAYCKCVTDKFTNYKKQDKSFDNKRISEVAAACVLSTDGKTAANNSAPASTTAAKKSDEAKSSN